MGRVLVIAPAYEYLPILVQSLLLQTYRDWELLLIHDGPSSLGVGKWAAVFADDRIRYVETLRRYNDWGHSLRQYGLDVLSRNGEADYVLITNGDNYYVPGFLAQMLEVFEEGVVASVCDMVHSHREWGMITARCQRKHIDCGAIVVRADVALEVGWQDNSFAADWFYIESIAKRYGSVNFRRVRRPLFIHN